jgi:hypothetical protein
MRAQIDTTPKKMKANNQQKIRKIPMKIGFMAMK